METVLDRLHALYRSHGLWVSNQVSIVRPGAEGAVAIQKAMARLAGDPPGRIGTVEVTSVTDFSTGAEQRPRYLPAASLVELELGDLGRLLVRPSGTEPKLKIYGDLRADVSSGDIAPLESRLLDRANGLARDLAGLVGLGE